MGEDWGRGLKIKNPWQLSQGVFFGFLKKTYT